MADESPIDPGGARSGGSSAAAIEFGPRAVSYPYRRIQRLPPSPSDGDDPYGCEDPEWLGVDWSHHLDWMEIKGTQVNYAEIGEGQPIVFVHGLGGCWQNWLENLPHFANAGYRAIALDLPGFGASPMPDWDITMPAYGELLDELCLRLNLHSVALVGNSMGGFIAAESATQMPEWIDHLVLVSAAGISVATMRKEPAHVFGRVANLASPLVSRATLSGVTRPGLRQMAFQGVFRHPQRIRRELLYEFSHTAVGAPAFTPAVISMAGYDFLDRLDRITTPSLLVWGRDDLVVPATEAPGYEERLANSELHIFDDCGHLPMAERPLRFNRLLQGFLERDR